MSKKLIKSIAATAAALLMATQAMAFSASAVQDYYYYYNGIYYSSPMDAAAAAGNNLGAYESVPYARIPASATLKYYDPVSKKYYDTKESAETAGVTNPAEIYVGGYYINTNYYTSGSGYYCSLTGKYYTTYSSALSAAGGQAKYVTYVGSVPTANRYYSSYTGLYYSTYDAALNASRGESKYVTYMGGDYWYDYYGYNYGYYYSNYTGKYYSSYQAALSASNGHASSIIPVGYLYNSTVTDSIYQYYYNGMAYATLKGAQQAGGTVGVDIYYLPYGYAAYKNSAYYKDPYYGYVDPYYILRNDLKNTTVSTKEAEAGEPYIYGNKKKAGWSTVIKYIKAAPKGTNINVDMNGADTISKDVLKALDGKNVSITCVLDNGVKWTINGKDIDKPQDMLIYTKYNIDYIPESLVNKASKDAVSKAQIGISNDYESFGAEASVTVRFDAKRAGCLAVVYRYDPDSNSLKGIDKAKVLSNGSCTFSVTAGGPYLIVLK